MTTAAGLMALFDDIAAAGGHVVRSCGATAAVVETVFAFGAEGVAWPETLAPGAVYRVHVMVDTTCACVDHVFFMTGGLRADAVYVLDSYVDVQAPRTALRSTEWLGAVAALHGADMTAEALTDVWRALFDVPTCSAFQGDVANIQVHVCCSEGRQPDVRRQRRARQRRVAALELQGNITSVVIEAGKSCVVASKVA